jgi:hypothetical protein
MMKFDWFEVTEQEAATYRDLCAPGHFRLLKPAQLPGPLPSGLTNKYDSVVLIASGLPTGGVCYMINGHRVDQKAMPLIRCHSGS